MLGEIDALLPGADAGAEVRLRAFVAHHLRYHVERQLEVFIGNSELRSLEPTNLEIILDLRHRYEGLLVDILESGMREGEFALVDVKVTASAILAMLTGICTWYRPDGRLSISDLIEVHTNLVLSGCGRSRDPSIPAPLRASAAG